MQRVSVTALSLMFFVPIFSTAVTVCATDGYFDHGYGVKAKGQGGAGVAFPQDSLATATNPAGSAFVGNRADIGITWFSPDRSADLGPGHFDGNGTSDFFIPEAGVNFVISPKVTLGVTIYGNGGMNTDYKTPIPAFGTTNAGVDLQQLFVAPSFTYKISEHHAIGIAPILAYEKFKAHGLQNFGIFDPGYDDAFGGGVRIGYTGQINDWLTIGATWQSRIYTGGFDKYKNLFAEQGGFDIPSDFAVGVAVKVHPQVTVALDVEEILYSDIAAVGNKLDGASFGAGLGSDNGPGFGWRDTTAIKLGVGYDVSKKLTLRAGYNFTTQPIPENQTFFNILAPAVVQHHATAGLTWHFNERVEASLFYSHAFEHEVKGAGNFGGGNANIRLSEDTVGVALGWKF